MASEVAITDFLLCDDYHSDYIYHDFMETRKEIGYFIMNERVPTVEGFSFSFLINNHCI